MCAIDEPAVRAVCGRTVLAESAEDDLASSGYSLREEAKPDFVVSSEGLALLRSDDCLVSTAPECFVLVMGEFWVGAGTRAVSCEGRGGDGV